MPTVMRRRPLLPILHSALFDISTLRKTVISLREQLEDAEAARFLSRLDCAEHAALRLLEQAEAKRNVAAH